MHQIAENKWNNMMRERLLLFYHQEECQTLDPPVWSVHTQGPGGASNLGCGPVLAGPSGGQIIFILESSNKLILRLRFVFLSFDPSQQIQLEGREGGRRVKRECDIKWLVFSSVTTFHIRWISFIFPAIIET